MDWSEVFHKHGSLRDIYIRGTTLADWNRFLDLVRTRSGLTASFRRDNQEAPMPGDASAVFADRQHAAPLLSLNLQGIVVNCHFFTHEEIELDVDPRQITNREQADRVFDFIAELGGRFGLTKDRGVPLTASAATRGTPPAAWNGPWRTPPRA